MTSYVLVGVTNILEEPAASIFRVEVNQVGIRER
jgi:hypothetical protein